MIIIRKKMIIRRGNMVIIWGRHLYFQMKMKREKFGKGPLYISLVKILGYMDEYYISPNLDKTLKLAF
jgi:hypothetical protein